MMIENEVLIQRKEYQNHPTIFMATEINDDDRLLLLHIRLLLQHDITLINAG